jgi:hypothetical protein
VSELLYQHGGELAFGRSRSMRCPHYVEDGGRCGVWRHRDSVCATWFCKHERGAVGRGFWHRTQQLLSSIERDLARWCVMELRLDAATLAEVFPLPTSATGSPPHLAAADMDGRRDSLRLAATWGAWAGREEELYRACAERVDGLALADVIGICGPEVRALAEIVRESWRKMVAPAAPRRLRVGQLRVIGQDASTCRVVTYSAFDPLEMPRELFAALHHFDGRSVEAARAAMSAAGGPAVGEGLLRKMLDFGVVVAVEDGQG